MSVKVSTGVVFGIKAVPLMVLNELNNQARKDKPKVPVCYIEEKDREELNDKDPRYLEAMEEWEANLNQKIYDGVIILGTTVEQLPDGFPGVDSNSWDSKLRLIGIDVPEDGDPRYLAWVKYCAAPAVDDINKLVLACSRGAGVTEADIAQASELFRNREERRANSKPLRKTQR